MVDLPDVAHFASISVRCTCGARYRTFQRNGLYSIEHVAVDDINESSIAAIEHDPALNASDKASKLDILIQRTEVSRTKHNEAFGKIIQKARKAHDKWGSK